MRKKNHFTFVDLFAGIGGFHGALSSMGGYCVLASEIDKYAASVYERNWGMRPEGDIRDFASAKRVTLPKSDQKISVLTGGFPCQPFSKSGKQEGMEEERGTLFDNIMNIVEKRHPSVVILENVRNLAGPRHKHEFDYIIGRLRTAGYQVSAEPSIFSPHKIREEFGGRPQIRERLFITATFAPRLRDNEPGKLTLLPEVVKEDVHDWNVLDYLDDEINHDNMSRLTDEEVQWIEAWEQFLRAMRSRTSSKLPGFPLWSDEWVAPSSNSSRKRRLSEVPDWKKSFLRSNWAFYDAHSQVIDKWRRRSDVESFPASRRKLEWQAQDEKSLWGCTLHLRPSGIRVKKLTYLPALVAMSQTSIIGPLKRKLTPMEAARLQGLPEDFDFGDQPISKTYHQLGNGVNVGVVQQVLRAHVLRDRALLVDKEPKLVEVALRWNDLRNKNVDLR